MSSHSLLNSSSGEIDHIHKAAADFGALYLSEKYSDLTLIVRGVKFPCHRIILASRSQYFHALLYGGMKESIEDTIELETTSIKAFSNLLEYIYKGRMSLAQENEGTIIQILALAHLYGFVDLEAAISGYLREILSTENICSILDIALLYNLEVLKKVCLEYMDKHAPEVIQNKTFKQMSPEALIQLLSRDSFYAPEFEIFLAVWSWVTANSRVNPKEVLAQIRLVLIPDLQILKDVRDSGLLLDSVLLDVLYEQKLKKNHELPHRGCLLVDENVACPKLGAQVLQGEMRNFLLNGDVKNYDLERGYTRHTISDKNDTGILIKLKKEYIINHIKMLLWDLDDRSYSYYIEGSINQDHWIRLIDHTEYYCRSWQYLYFEPKVIMYIRIVGTNNTVNKVFHVVSFEAYYTNHTVKLCKGIIVPTQNVALAEKSAAVIEGVSRFRHTLLNGDITNYDWDSGYTCHQLGSGNILIQLGQPYMIDSMRLLLWDCDNRSYSYYIQVSGNRENWKLVVDKSREPCRSWQTIRFSPGRPVVFIRIVGTHNTANEVFHCVHFECPAQLEDKSSKSPKHCESSEGENISSSLPSLLPLMPEVAREAVHIDDNDD